MLRPMAILAPTLGALVAFQAPLAAQAPPAAAPQRPQALPGAESFATANADLRA